MAKGKARNNPNKPQNLYGSWCAYAETYNNTIHCECGYGSTDICKGNRHNCIKTKYHTIASLSDIQKNNLYK